MVQQQRPHDSKCGAQRQHLLVQRDRDDSRAGIKSVPLVNCGWEFCSELPLEETVRRPFDRKPACSSCQFSFFFLHKPVNAVWNMNASRRTENGIKNFLEALFLGGVPLQPTLRIKCSFSVMPQDRC